MLNTKDYELKMTKLLQDANTYEILPKDPTAKYKRELINMIKKWQKEDAIPIETKHRIYPTAEEVPKIYGTPNP